MKVKWLKDFTSKGVEYKKDGELEVTDSSAQLLITKGFAAKVEEAVEEPEIEVAVTKAVKAAVATEGQPPLQVLPQDVRVVNKKYEGAFDSADDAYAFGMLYLRKGMDNGSHRVNEKSAWAWERLNGAGPRLGLTKKDVTAYEGTGVIPEIWIPAIVRLIQQYGVARSHMRHITMSTNKEYHPRSTNLLTIFKAEAGAVIQTSNMTTGNFALEAMKRGALSYIPREFSEDAVISLMEEQTVRAALSFAKNEDDTAFLGDGTTDGSPEYFSVLGCGNALLADPYSGIVTASGGTGTGTAAITAGNIQSVAGKLPPMADIDLRAAWYMNKEMYFGRFVDVLMALGGARVVEATEVINGRSQMMFGYPIVWTQVMPGSVLTDTGEFVAYLANLNLASAFGIRREYALESTLLGPGWPQDCISVKMTERIAQYHFGTHTMENKPGPIIGLRVKGGASQATTTGAATTSAHTTEAG